jgi:hypothetical protein
VLLCFFLFQSAEEERKKAIGREEEKGGETEDRQTQRELASYMFCVFLLCKTADET